MLFLLFFSKLFIYLITGPEDRVKCFKCEIGLADWNDSDIVIQEHRDHSPSCPFVKQIAKQLKDKVRSVQNNDRLGNVVDLIVVFFSHSQLASIS